jgi:hypothetical protein
MPSTNGHGPKRSILYARVSTDEQARSGYSLAQQIEALRAYAAREGYEVLEEVVAPVRAAQAWRGQVWTACGISWLEITPQEDGILDVRGILSDSLSAPQKYDSATNDFVLTERYLSLG